MSTSSAPCSTSCAEPVDAQRQRALAQLRARGGDQLGQHGVAAEDERVAVGAAPQPRERDRARAEHVALLRRALAVRRQLDAAPREQRLAELGLEPAVHRDGSPPAGGEVHSARRCPGSCCSRPWRRTRRRWAVSLRPHRTPWQEIDHRCASIPGAGAIGRGRSCPIVSSSRSSSPSCSLGYVVGALAIGVAIRSRCSRCASPWAVLGGRAVGQLRVAGAARPDAAAGRPVRWRVRRLRPRRAGRRSRPSPMLGLSPLVTTASRSAAARRTRACGPGRRRGVSLAPELGNAAYASGSP